MDKVRQRTASEVSATSSPPKKVRLEETDLEERFEGCLLGALAGDCLGARFEFNEDVERNEVVAYINKMCRETSIPPNSSQIAKYTDDSAMAHDICVSLLECGDFDAKNLAQRFGKTYFDGVSANKSYAYRYGSNTKEILKQLHCDASNPFEPAAAKERLTGEGNYRNGAAMRVAPVALFYAQNRSKMLEVARDQARITHTHPHGIMGSSLQAAAVFTALHTPYGELIPDAFLNTLENICDEIEAEIYRRLEAKVTNVYKYKSKLKDIQDLLGVENMDEKRVFDELGGNSLRADVSVPAAIFVFLKCLKPFKNYQEENPLIRTITYAICLGGDTDTVGTMAGAIAGAYYGSSKIPKSWFERLEGADNAVVYAKAMHERYKSNCRNW